MHDCRSIHAYWFGTVDLREPPASDREDWWWVADDAIDHEITKAFASDVRNASQGALIDWEVAAESSLALIILLDQFSRSIWRGSARAFENDAHALLVARRAVRAGHDARAHPLKRIFFYMPFMHAEAIGVQDRCVALFTELRDTTNGDLRPRLEHHLGFALKHRDVIRKFGRFPSRNAALGRASTPDEAAFLAHVGPGW